LSKILIVTIYSSINKRKLIPHHEDVRSRGMLNDPAALLPGKSPWYPSYRSLGGLQSQSGCGGDEKNPWPAGNWTPVVQLVAQSLYWQVNHFRKPRTN